MCLSKWGYRQNWAGATKNKRAVRKPPAILRDHSFLIGHCSNDELNGYFKMSSLSWWLPQAIQDFRLHHESTVYELSPNMRVVSGKQCCTLFFSLKRPFHCENVLNFPNLDAQVGIVFSSKLLGPFTKGMMCNLWEQHTTNPFAIWALDSCLQGPRCTICSVSMVVIS